LLGEAQRVLTVHDVLHLKYPKLYEGPKPPTIQRVLDSLDPDDDWVITVSEQTRRDLLSLRPIDAGRVTSIHLGSAIGTSGPLPNGVEPGFVLAVVQAEPRKNLDATIGGIARALDAEGNVTRQVVLVVGSSTMGDADSAVREAGLSTDRVRYVHSPSDAELARLYEDAAVFVFGSIYEGFGLPPLEALSGGTPTVAVMVSSMIEVLGDAVVYATSGSPEAIAQALSAVLGSASLRSALTQRARERAKQLGWERSTSSHVDFYRQATIAGRR
jgi:glycosyltransferase involved in cell wall biosynthesis